MKKGTTRKHGPESLALKRFRGDAMWSFVMIAILTAGLASSIVVPSAGTTLESGLTNYADTVGTYLNVAPTAPTLGQNPSNMFLPQGVVNEIANATGVQKVYPLITNYTNVVHYNVTVGNLRVRSLTVSFMTALLGNSSGFPPALIQLIQGSMPKAGAAEYLSLTTNNPGDLQSQLNQTTQVEIANVRFNATLVGFAAAYSPITDSISYLFDSSFLLKELGPTIFNQTFRQEGYNYVIVKVDSIGHITNAAGEIANIVKQYPAYQVSYDQASAMNLNALITQTAPFYEALGVVSLGITALVTLFVSWLGVRRRSWEAAMLATQGWSWSSLSRFYVAYFLAIAAASFSLALIISYFLSPWIGFSLQLYGRQIGLQTIPQRPYVISSFVLALVLSLGATIMVVRRLRKRGLDDILREY